MLKRGLIAAILPYVENGTITEKQAKEIVSLPLVEVPEFQNIKEIDVTDYDRFITQELNAASHRMFLSSSDYVFLEATYQIINDSYYSIKLTDIQDDPRRYKLTIQNIPEVKSEWAGAQFLVVHVDVDFGQKNPYSISNITIKTGDKTFNDLIDQEVNKAVEHMLIQLLTNIALFTHYQESLDRYPVTVTKAKPKLNKGNMKRLDKRLEAASYNAPRLIYLDKLPNSKTDTISTPSGIKQKSHQRPGHYRTLTHERYKKHEKYGIPNGVRVKPYWVGDKETIHEGNVYRLITKEPIDETL